MATQLNNTTVTLSGEYAVCWRSDNIIFQGPEQTFGTISTPFNIFYDNDLAVVEQFIKDNELILPEVC